MAIHSPRTQETMMIPPALISGSSQAVTLLGYGALLSLVKLKINIPPSEQFPTCPSEASQTSYLSLELSSIYLDINCIVFDFLGIRQSEL